MTKDILEDTSLLEIDKSLEFNVKLGFIEELKKDGNKFYRITPKGRTYTENYVMNKVFDPDREARLFSENWDLKQKLGLDPTKPLELKEEKK